MSSAFDDTRRSLHAVAEYLLSGPQYRASATIRLRVRSGGFATITEPDVRVDGAELVTADGRGAIDGSTLAAIAAVAGLDGGTAGIYPDGSAVGPDDVLIVDVIAAAKLAEAYSVGDAALRAFVPETEPALWPEHFDLAVRVDDVNYGVSPGDAYLDRPYAYVGVDPVPQTAFWNAPFGAVRPLAELAGVDAVVDFFTEGRAATRAAR